MEYFSTIWFIPVEKLIRYSRKFDDIFLQKSLCHIFEVTQPQP